MFITQHPVLTEEQVSEYRSRFILEPLESGFDYALGNSMRRTLLSLISSAAATSVRIDGVLYKFSTIARVKEGVAGIILNLRELAVSSENGESVLMYLYRQGLGEIMAADIMPPAGVEIHNLDLHIATLNDRGKIEINLIVERGRGHISAAQNKGKEDEIGRIPIDSTRPPVLKVSYKAETTWVAQRTDSDKLVVDVKVGPLVTPWDVLVSADKIFVELFGLCVELNSEVEGIELGPPPAAETQSSDLQ